MTDLTPSSEPEQPAGEHGPAGSPDLSVDVAAFLPEGSSVDDGSGADDTVPTPGDTTGDVVDLRVLEQLEADLAGVDAAIEAIDADDHARSPLLRELVADAPTTGTPQHG